MLHSNVAGQPSIVPAAQKYAAIVRPDLRIIPANLREAMRERVGLHYNLFCPMPWSMGKALRSAKIQEIAKSVQFGQLLVWG